MGEEDITGEGLILSFTDGLIDLKSDTGTYFGDDEIERVINSTDNIPTASQFIEILQSEMDLFRGEQEFPDDIAVLTCKFEC